LHATPPAWSAWARPPPPPSTIPYTTLFRSTHFDTRVARRGERNLRVGECRVVSVGDRSVERRGGSLIDGELVVVFEFENRGRRRDRKSTRLNSSHASLSYAVSWLP